MNTDNTFSESHEAEQNGTEEQTGQRTHEAFKKQSDERSWAMLCHLSVLAAAVIPFGHIFGPLIVWLVKRDEFDLVNDQGKESLNFQISLSIYSLILTVVAVVSVLGLAAGDGEGSVLITLIGAGVGLFVIGILALIFVIIASVRSYQGERYRYPLSIRFVS